MCVDSFALQASASSCFMLFQKETRTSQAVWPDRHVRQHDVVIGLFLFGTAIEMDPCWSLLVPLPFAVAKGWKMNRLAKKHT